jgi:hypothetical protein
MVGVRHNNGVNHRNCKKRTLSLLLALLDFVYSMGKLVLDYDMAK